MKPMNAALILPKMRCWNKRGDLTWWTLVKAVPAMLVFAFMMYGAGELASSDFFFKIYASQDISALVESIQAVPGEVNIFYPTNMSQFKVELSDHKVRVTTARLDPTSSSSYFTHIQGYDYDEGISGYSYIYFKGAPSSLSVTGSSEVQDYGNVFGCPTFDTSDTITDKRVALDPEILNNADALYDIANFLAHDSTVSFSVYLTRPRGAPVTVDKRLEKVSQDTDITIALRSHISAKIQEPTLSVGISGNSQHPARSSKLACLIQKRITSVIPEIKIDPLLVSTSDEISSKSPAEISILLKFNFNDESQAEDILSKQGEIAKAIVYGINKYYSDSSEEME